MGACTVSGVPNAPPDGTIHYVDGQGVVVNGRFRRLNVTFSASYATGGDTLPVAAIGLRNIHALLIEPHTGALGDALQSGLSVRLGGTPQAPTLRAFDAVATEVANTTNLSTRIINCWLIGD